MKTIEVLVTDKEYEEIANSTGSLLEVYNALKSRFDEADNHKGEWSGNWDYYCSVCHNPFEYRTPYCPYCGAKMKNGSEDLI